MQITTNAFVVFETPFYPIDGVALKNVNKVSPAPKGSQSLV